LQLQSVVSLSYFLPLEPHLSRLKNLLFCSTGSSIEGLFGFRICPAVATLENASFAGSMVQLGADHFVRTRQFYVSFGSSQRA
jgi:hypothetical protein